MHQSTERDMSLNPYLTSNGNCREAFDFYRSVFGGRIRSGFHVSGRSGRHGDSRSGMEIGSCTFRSPIGSSFLLGSDISASLSPPVATGTHLAISFDAQDRQQADRVFAGPCGADGKVIMPMEICSGARTSV